MAVERFEFGSLIFTMTYDFSRLERNFCKVAGLYQGQPRILTILQQHQGVTLSELSPLCSIGMPSLSVSVRNLQKSGLIRKEGSGKNQKIFLTDIGQARALQFHELIDAFYADFLQQLGPEASAEMYRAFQRFDSHIRDFNQKFEADHGWCKT